MYWGSQTIKTNYINIYIYIYLLIFFKETSEKHFSSFDFPYLA
jgi:hypothetical protein